MVSFTHVEAGTSEREWEAAAGWDRVGDLRLDGITRMLVVAAHPDDESFGAGGLIAMAAARGLQVRVVVATDGELSHPRSRTHPPERLAARRRGEAREAARVLGVHGSPRLLGLPDGELEAHESILVASLSRLLAELGPEGLLVVAPWRGDGHPDHEAAGRAAVAAADTLGVDVLEYPVWLWHWAAPDAPEVPWSRMARLPLTGPAQHAKHRAILAHRSQIAPLSAEPGDEALLGHRFRAHFERDFEVYLTPGSECGPQDAARDMRQTALGAGASGDPAGGGERAGAGSGSLTADYFEAFYGDTADPWGYETRWYERRKRAVTLAALPRPRFARALEVGCSIGVLTQELATRCDRVLGVDIAEAPLRTARERLGERPDIEFRRLDLPGAWPEGEFDLVVLSEVGYYWDAEGLEDAIARSIACLGPDGVLLACHWRHPVADYPQRGDDVHARLAARGELVRTVHHLEEDFVLEVYQRPPGASVARETGLV